MRFESKFEYKVHFGQTLKGLFDKKEWAIDYYKNKVASGRKNVKIVEVRTDVTETPLRIE